MKIDLTLLLEYLAKYCYYDYFQLIIKTLEHYILFAVHELELINSMAYGTRRFNTAFTRVLQKSLSLAESTQLLVLLHISLRSILILSSHLRLGLPKGEMDCLMEENHQQKLTEYGTIFNLTIQAVNQ